MTILLPMTNVDGEGWGWSTGMGNGRQGWGLVDGGGEWSIWVGSVAYDNLDARFSPVLIPYTTKSTFTLQSPQCQ